MFLMWWVGVAVNYHQILLPTKYQIYARAVIRKSYVIIIYEYNFPLAQEGWSACLKYCMFQRVQFGPFDLPNDRALCPNMSTFIIIVHR